MRWLAVVVMFAGCGFSLTLGDNNMPADARLDAVSEMDAEIDAPPAACPVFYHPIGTGMYVVLNPTNFRNHVAACASHGTHLAIIDTQEELEALVDYGETVAGVNADSRFYVGVVQAPMEAEPGTGWIDFQDRDVPNKLWSTSGNNEPNDGSDENETNHQEQVGALRLDLKGLVDLDSGQNVRAYCECDAVTVGPKATMYLMAPNL
jgi:hypothetical protein